MRQAGHVRDVRNPSRPPYVSPNSSTSGAMTLSGLWSDISRPHGCRSIQAVSQRDGNPTTDTRRHPSQIENRLRPYPSHVNSLPSIHPSAVGSTVPPRDRGTATAHTGNLGAVRVRHAFTHPRKEHADERVPHFEPRRLVDSSCQTSRVTVVPSFPSSAKPSLVRGIPARDPGTWEVYICKTFQAPDGFLCRLSS